MATYDICLKVYVFEIKLYNKEMGVYYIPDNNLFSQSVLQKIITKAWGVNRGGG